MNKRIITLIIAALSTVQLFSQSIKGTILNSENNKPIHNASISIANSVSGTASNNEGYFYLHLSKDTLPTILISCLGFENKQYKVSKDDLIGKIKIKLQPTSIHINKSIVVTASKNKLLSFDISEAVSVLTKEELKHNAPRSMAEALIGTPGVWMQKTNHGGGSPFIRGLTGNQTLLLVDGIRLNNAAFRYGPNQYFNTIDVFSVNQVEVIRGKGSVLYGSDALGGVINVITKSPEFINWKPRLITRGRLKFMDKAMEQSAGVELEYQSRKFAIQGNSSYKNFGDIYAGGELGYLRPSGYKEVGLNIKAKFRISDKWLIIGAINSLSQNDVHRYDQVAQRGYEMYKFDPQIHRLLYSRAEYFSVNPIFKKVSITVSNQLSDETRIKQKQESSVINVENDVVKNYGFVIDNYSEFNEFWTAISGLEYYSDKIHSSKTETDTNTGQETIKRGLYPDNSKMKSLALYSQHSAKFNKIKLQIGGRFNLNKINSVDEIFGEVDLNPMSLVGNFTFQYLPNKTNNYIFSANTAFRAPNINDISSFGSFDYGIEIPSENLSPEKAITIEGGYKRVADKFTFSLFAFNTRLKNQIIRVKAQYNGEDFIDGEQVYKKDNLAKSNIYGIESELGFKLNKHFSLINNATWLYGEDLDKNEPMRRIPPFNGKLALRYSKSRLFGETELLFAATQNRLSGGDIDDHRIPEGGTPGWSILNFKLGYSWDKISLNSGIQNIFNQSYRIHGSGVDGYGRSLWVSMLYEI